MGHLERASPQGYMEQGSVRGWRQAGRDVVEIRRLAPGDRVLDYRILERLGEGGFGEVFRAEHEVLGRIVAIKVPRDASGVAALRHEGVVQARLEHPNIVQTLELSISHDPPYVV